MTGGSTSAPMAELSSRLQLLLLRLLPPQVCMRHPVPLPMFTSSLAKGLTTHQLP